MGSLRALQDEAKEGGVVERFRTQRAGILLACLAIKPGRPRSRESLGEMLWPDVDPQVQRARLRYELTVLRTALGPDVLVSQGNHSLSLSSTVSSDVAEFDAALLDAVRAGTPERRLPSLKKAIALNRDDLLPGIDLPDGCPPEYDWILLERERLREAGFDAFTRLVLDLEELGFLDEARAFRRAMSLRFPDRSLPPPPSPPSTALPISSPTANRFFGRESTITQLRNWAQARDGSRRLITLTGPGGIGKTRLAIEATRGLSAVFVPLADVSAGARFFENIHRALALPAHGGLSPREEVEEVLRERGSCLLILDNLEHIAPEVAPHIAALLRSCPQLRCLATSRRALKAEGETAAPLAPLSQEEGLALFLDRARAVRPDFATTEDGARAAIAVVGLLEGLPLALELAAARAVVLGPAQMREQLARRLRFLVSVRPKRDSRHQSIHAALEWSVDLLSAAARRTLTRLSVFRGGASLAGVRAVCGDEPPVLDLLEELTLHSLLTVSFGEDEEARYEQLTVVQEFADELLNSDERMEARHQHAEYFASEADDIKPLSRSGKWDSARRRIIRDLENVRRAAVFATETRAHTLQYRLMDGLVVPLFELGFWDDAAVLVAGAEPATIHAPQQRVRYLGLRGALARRRGDEDEAQLCWEEQLTLCRLLQEPDLLASILFDLAGQAIDREEGGRAAALLNEGLACAAAAGLPHRLVVGNTLRARLIFAQGNPTGARPCAETALAMLAKLEANPTLRLYVIIHVLPIYRALDVPQKTRELLCQGLALAQDNAQTFLLGRVATEVGLYCEARQDYATALCAFYVAREIHAELRSRLRRASAEALDRFLAPQSPQILQNFRNIDGEPWAPLVEKMIATL